jgi:molybdenum cofactor biosynthesis enzyme MoaA
MKLEDIGFYTLCDDRCKNVSDTSPMWRCEMILTERCNFNCPYCRGLRADCQGDMTLGAAVETMALWASQGLKHIRFSGGEPMIWPHLGELVRQTKLHGVERIAISTNGSWPLEKYLELVDLGVNDFSISLDACCAADCGQMAGVGGENLWSSLIKNIHELSKVTYVTVGVVLTDENLLNLRGIVNFAHEMGVDDIRIIPAAQNGNMIKGVERIPQGILDAHPILAFRVKNILAGTPVRSIKMFDSHRCYIPLDDSVVAGKYHFPCVIYMREQGEPIGEVGPNMRAERLAWSETHNSFQDPICQKNCLDVCVAHNNKCSECRLDQVTKKESND